MSTGAVAETLFEEYCRANSVRCSRVAVGSERSPDFKIEIGQTEVVCEVKQIDVNPKDREVMPDINRGEAIGFYVANRLRAKLKDVSAQLQAAANAGVPTMVILHNNSPVYDYTGHSDVVQAMFGRKSSVVTFSDLRDTEPSVAGPFFGGNRGLGPDRNTSVSAVAILERGSDGDLRLRMYHNPFATVRLDPTLLSSLPVVQPVLPDTEEIEL